ncbi:MAG: DUF1223 domain-containing protein [Planctomycetota bacterium]|jgi:hypothetical protein
MTRIMILALAASLHLHALAATASPAPPASRPAPSSAAGVAVVELFTSEGCSSCPPAEKVANKITRRARADGAPVYVIAFHVDYWDRLGWPDRFASATFTERQNRYARAMSSNRVYTPQMIVNGTKGFVGSDGKRASQEIAKARTKAAPAKVTVTRPRRRGDEVSVRVGVDTKRDGEHLVVNVAVVEDGLATDVTRGENAGRRLEHDAVARAFVTIPLAELPDGDVTVPIPHNLVTARAAVIAYVQDTRTMAITGAAGRRFNPSR